MTSQPALLRTCSTLLSLGLLVAASTGCATGGSGGGAVGGQLADSQTSLIVANSGGGSRFIGGAKATLVAKDGTRIELGVTDDTGELVMPGELPALLPRASLLLVCHPAFSCTVTRSPAATLAPGNSAVVSLTRLVPSAADEQQRAACVHGSGVGLLIVEGGSGDIITWDTVNAWAVLDNGTIRSIGTADREGVVRLDDQMTWLDHAQLIFACGEGNVYECGAIDLRASSFEGWRGCVVLPMPMANYM